MTSTKEATAGLFDLANEVPFRIAPERAQEMKDEIFGKEGWKILPSNLEAFFSAVVEDRKIYLSYAGLASLWCLSYAGFHTMDVASRLSADSRMASVSSIDLGQMWAGMRLVDYVNYARRLCAQDEQWPAGLTLPDPTADFDSEAGRTNNLFFGALSWIILHEIGHLYFTHPRLVGHQIKISNEWQADGFATQWALDKAAGDQREFRVLAICVAQAWLLLFEQARWGQVDHPPSIQRFREAASRFDVDDDSPALENATYLLKAVFDPATLMPESQNARQAFEWIEERLVEIFPQR